MKKLEEVQKVDTVKERDFFPKNVWIWGDQNPYSEAVNVLEDLVIEFVMEMTHKAMSFGRQGRVQVEDTVFLI
jgi:hypothetical protein